MFLQLCLLNLVELLDSYYLYFCIGLKMSPLATFEMKFSIRCGRRTSPVTWLASEAASRWSFCTYESTVFFRLYQSAGNFFTRAKLNIFGVSEWINIINNFYLIFFIYFYQYKINVIKYYPSIFLIY